MADKVDPKVRKVEQEIDNHYKSNFLLSLPFGTAAWYLLAYYEDRSLFSIVKNPNASMHEVAAISDNLVVELQYSLNWLKTGCQPGGNVNIEHNEKAYAACNELSDLALNYMAFVVAYKYASRGKVKLILDNNTLTPLNYVFKDSRYEAYGRLIKQEDIEPDLVRGAILEAVDKSLSVTKKSFSYKLGKRLLERTIKSMGQVYDEIFELPDSWKFPNYSLADFRRMERYLMSSSMIHFLARFIAATKGCEGLGIANSLIIGPYAR